MKDWKSVALWAFILISGFLGALLGKTMGIYYSSIGLIVEVVGSCLVWLCLFVGLGLIVMAIIPYLVVMIDTPYSFLKRRVEKLHSSIMLISGSVIAVPIGTPYLMLLIMRPACIFDARYYNSTALFGLLSGALGIAGGLVASRSVAGTLGIVGSLTSLHGFFGTFGVKFPRIFIETLPPFMEMYEAALVLMLIGGILALLSLARDAVRKVKIDEGLEVCSL